MEILFPFPFSSYFMQLGVAIIFYRYVQLRLLLFVTRVPTCVLAIRSSSSSRSSCTPSCPYGSWRFRSRQYSPSYFGVLLGHSLIYWSHEVASYLLSHNRHSPTRPVEHVKQDSQLMIRMMIWKFFPKFYLPCWFLSPSR